MCCYPAIYTHGSLLLAAGRAPGFESTFHTRPLACLPACLQALAPLVRRFEALRGRLLENDHAAKGRLDAAADQLR